MRYDPDREPWYGADPLVDLRRIALNPTKEGRGIDRDTALLHHLGAIAIADPILAVPAHA